MSFNSDKNYITIRKITLQFGNNSINLSLQCDTIQVRQGGTNILIDQEIIKPTQPFNIQKKYA